VAWTVTTSPRSSRRAPEAARGAPTSTPRCSSSCSRVRWGSTRTSRGRWPRWWWPGTPPCSRRRCWRRRRGASTRTWTRRSPSSHGPRPWRCR
ncbi:MAG: hypothetical protein AVDCRST_MAG35-2427, partial [uncultured Quadrisphaera sp.]